MARVTLKEVARRAETSIATVSRVLNGTDVVAHETKARVLDAIKELNYHPNLRAKALRERLSYSIGLIIPHLRNPYYTDLADALSRMLGDRGYHLLLAATNDDQKRQEEIVYGMVGQEVDGLIWVPGEPSGELVDYVRGQDIPVVSMVRRVPDDAVDTVVFEDMQGARTAIRHLISLGHRRIGFIISNAALSTNRAREQGYYLALEEAGLAPDAQLIRSNVDHVEAGLIMTELLNLPHPPTAVFVGSNPLVPGVLTALRQSRIQLPGQMSLVCFDDIEWFAYLDPPMTAVSVSTARLADAALRLLLRRMEHPAKGMAMPPAFVEIGYDLILRGSTAPLHEGGVQARYLSRSGSFYR